MSKHVIRWEKQKESLLATMDLYPTGSFVYERLGLACALCDLKIAVWKEILKLIGGK
jgi:hypothetical protein